MVRQEMGASVKGDWSLGAADKSVLVNKVSIDWTRFCSPVITGDGRLWCQLCNISQVKRWAQQFYRNCTLCWCGVLHLKLYSGMIEVISSLLKIIILMI